VDTDKRWKTIKSGGNPYHRPICLHRHLDKLPWARRPAFALHLSTPRPPGPGGPLTGVDYLAVIAERHRRRLHRRLRLADPSGALAALRGWPLINLLTGGRLLASGPAG
jgi:hypothetical protein